MSLSQTLTDVAIYHFGRNKTKGAIIRYRPLRFIGVGKPPALPVEVPGKKALASSIERSELLTASYQEQKTAVRTEIARLRACGASDASEIKFSAS